jgi:hypothetical protein
MAVQMQARSSSNGQIYTWVTGAPDWAGSGFPGPGTPEDVALAARPALQGQEGDVVGAPSSLANRIAGFLDASGKNLKDLGLVLADLGINVKAFGAKGDNATNDQTAIANAVAGALALGKDLFWPDGTYISSATIANLHLVRHRGPGLIKRGTDVFAVQPLSGNTNRLYIATTGNAANDGLSSSQPMVKPQDAFNALKTYGPYLEGAWHIVCAAGSYSLKEQQHTTPSRDYVYLEGPAVSMGTLPTAVFDGTGFAAGEHGFRVVGTNVQLWAKNIKVQDYNAGSQNSIGIFVGFNARLVTENVHGDNCDWGAIVADGGDLCYVNGGKFSANRSHVVINATRGWVGYQNGCTFSGATQSGVYWSRSAQGHIDNCVFDTASPYHIALDTNARAHILGCDFRLASVAAISTDSGGNFFNDPSLPNAFNDGTGNANAKRFAFSAFSGEQTELMSSRSERRIFHDSTTRTLTSAAKAQIGGDLQLVGGKPTLGAYRYVDSYSKIRIKVWGETPAASTKIGIDCYDSTGPTTTVMEYAASTGTPAASGFEYECTIYPSSTTTQRSFSNFACSNLGVRYQNTGNAADFRKDQMLRLMGESASGSIIVRRIEVWVTD